ncbi:MAG: aldose 1-epimerase family protein, partial [Acidimicrobiaceae bacterium]|nr:aldose 1-epimerase family protein [Acidimicrobiaceae bacterium]
MASDQVGPNGKEGRLRFAEQDLVVCELGATLRSYRWASNDVIDGFRYDQACHDARGQTLIPWPNRIIDARYSWNSKKYQLDISEPLGGNAIHGLTRWQSWRLASQSETSLVYSLVLYPCAGWPFTLDAWIEYSLGKTGLSVITRVKNIGVDPAPFGTGAHPYFKLGDYRVDSLLLEVPASIYYPVQERGIPGPGKPCAGSPCNLSSPAPIGNLEFDIAMSGLKRDQDGVAHVSLIDPSGDSITLWMDKKYDFIQIYSADRVLDPNRRRMSIALEPMTCAPDAFNSGNGLITLNPGEE